MEMTRIEKLKDLFALMRWNKALNYPEDEAYSNYSYSFSGLCSIYGLYMGRGGKNLKDMLPELYCQRDPRYGGFWWTTNPERAWKARHKAIWKAIWMVILFRKPKIKEEKSVTVGARFIQTYPSGSSNAVIQNDDTAMIVTAASIFIPESSTDIEDGDRRDLHRQHYESGNYDDRPDYDDRSDYDSGSTSFSDSDDSTSGGFD